MEPNQDKKSIEVDLGHSQEFYVIEIPDLPDEVNEVRVEW